MLRPSKHSHPDRTAINVSVLLLAHLKKKRVVDYATLRALVKKKQPEADVLFLPALNLLYLLGLVEYRPKTDAIEYRGGA